MGFSHRRSHPSKTCIAKDTLRNRNTGMKLTDNKFNHNTIGCKPNRSRATDSKIYNHRKEKAKPPIKARSN